MTQLQSHQGKRAGSNLLALLDSIDLAHAALASEDVHRIRVAIKQTRAWLKLCRAVTGKTAAYQQVLADLRELSTALAGQRDRDVAVLTLAKLARKYPGKKVQHLVDVLSRQLAQSQPLTPETAPPAAVVDQIRHGLLPFTQQLLPATLQTEVVRRTYAKMCRAGAAALESAACADLHAWRKLVKTLGYQLGMVELREAGMSKLLARLTRLGSKLGAIHDLCFLQVMIEETIAQARLELELAPLLKRIAKERNVLIAAVHKLHRQVCHSLPQLTVIS
jgi:CHAD domain-containing protein